MVYRKAGVKSAKKYIKKQPGRGSPCVGKGILGAGGVSMSVCEARHFWWSSQVECMPRLTHGRSDVVHLGPGTATVQTNKTG